MIATPASVTAAIDHAQKIVNTAAALHDQAVARIEQLHPVAPSMEEFTGVHGGIDPRTVAESIRYGRLPECLGLTQPESLAQGPVPLPMIDHDSDREQGIYVGGLCFQPEKKRPKTKSFPLEIAPRWCYQIEITAFLEHQAPATIKITAFPAR
ncbi:MAG: hypothetical protein ACTH2M_00095 [Microbacteriaceae bacterium]